MQCSRLAYLCIVLAKPQIAMPIMMKEKMSTKLIVAPLALREKCGMNPFASSMKLTIVPSMTKPISYKIALQM